MNEEPKKPTPYDVSDALFADMVNKAKQYDELVANLVAGRKIRPNETGDFQAVLGVVANMAAAPNTPPLGSWEAVQQAGEDVIRNRQTLNRDQIKKILSEITSRPQPNELALRFEEMVSTLHKIGALHNPFAKPDEVVRVVLAPFLAGWRADDDGTLTRIFDTLSHYGQLRSASAVQSVKELCDEYETIWSLLTNEKFQPGDRLLDIVRQLKKDVDAQPRDAADAQEIAKYLSDVYPTQNHSLPNAVRALFENYKQGMAGRLESTEEPLFLELLRAKVAKSRALHPSPVGFVQSLDELVDDLESRLITDYPIGKIIKRAVKIAAVAWRLAEEGDHRYNDLRKANNASPFPKWQGNRVSSVRETVFFINESSNNPNHPEVALSRIGKALVDAGQLDPEEATRFGECAFAVEVLLSNKKSADELLNRIGERIEKTGFLIGKNWNQETLLSALEAIIQNDRTNVGDTAISFRKTRSELLLLTKTTNNAALIDEVRRLATRTADDWALAFPKQVAAFLLERGLYNEAWPSTPEQVRVAITEVVIKLQAAQEQVANLIHHGPQHLFFLLSDAGVMDTYNEPDLPSLEQGINRLIDQRKEASADLKSTFAELNAANDKNAAQKVFIEKIDEMVRDTFGAGKTNGTLPSIWAGVNDLMKNYIHAREAEVAFEELGIGFYTGSLVEKTRRAIRLIQQKNKGFGRLVAAVQQVGGVDLGDPSSVESIEGAILNLGWQLGKVNVRQFADGQRVFVHYFDGCSDEYLGQKAAEVRGAKYVSAEFGWFYMVEFEEEGIGAMKFDYSESRLALVPEAYLLAGDRVRLRDSQTEATVVKSYHYEGETAIRYELAEIGNGNGEQVGFLETDLIPVSQQWSIFDRKGGKTRLMVLHAPDKWAAEKRAAERLSRAGKPYVTLALIAVPGVADNAHFGGVTDGVEVSVYRKAGRDKNMSFTTLFDGNNVDVNNAIEAIKSIVHAGPNDDPLFPTSNRIEKLLPRLRGLANHRDTPAKYKAGDSVETYQAAKGDEPISGTILRAVDHDFGTERWSYWLECGYLIGQIERWESDLKPAWDAPQSPPPTADNTPRKFTDGQNVTLKYVDLSAKNHLSEAAIRELNTTVVSAEFVDGVWQYVVTTENAGQKTYGLESDLQPRALFTENQRVIVKSPGYEGKRFAKVISRSYSDWSRVWSYDVEFANAAGKVSSRYEVDLEAVPDVNHDALIQQAVTDIVDRQETEEEHINRLIANRPKPKFKTGDRVLVQPSGRADTITGEPAYSAHKDAWAYPVEGEKEHVLEGWLRPDLRPEPKFKKGDEVNQGYSKMVWFINSRDWSSRGFGWLYSMTQNPDGTGSAMGGVREDELKGYQDAVLSRFLVASRDLQVEADKMVGKYVYVARDAEEQAIRDGAVNPAWKDWLRPIAAKRLIVTGARVAPLGYVEYTFDGSGFALNAKYLDDVLPTKA